MSEFMTIEEKAEYKDKASELVAKYSPDHTKMIAAKVDDKLTLYFPQGTAKSKIKKAVNKHKKKYFMTDKTKKLFSSEYIIDKVNKSNVWEN